MVTPLPRPELIHQLQMRQLELEIENEALRESVASLQKSEAWNDLILERLPAALLVVDAQGRVIRANKGAYEVFAYPAGSMPGMNIAALIPERFRPDHDNRVTRFLETPQTRDMGDGRELRSLRRDGSEFPSELRLVPLRLGERSYVVVSVLDISERKRAEEEAHIAAIAFESQSGMLVTDRNGIILRVNRAFTRLTGYSAEEAVGRTPRLLSSGRHAPEFYAEMWTAIGAKGHWQGQIWNRRKDGRVFAEWLTITAISDAEGKVTHYVSTFSDITENAEAEAQIHRLAYYDALTGLPNRLLLQDRLGQAVAASARTGRHGALLFLDLDNFKTVNDTRGHDTGDHLLIEVTRRLLQTVRESDTVARLGGDEFVVILEELSETATEAAAMAQQVAEKLCQTIGMQSQIDGHELRCTTSIGIGLFRRHETVEDLLKHADLAMYHAKSCGRNTLRFFDPAMQAKLDERSLMEAELHKALRHDQFQLHYQAQIGADGAVIGAETLLRWLHPQRGLIAPGEFIPLAEESGLILPIGQWVLETACAQLAAWSTNSSTDRLMLAVNVSASQFRHTDFVAQVRSALDASGASPDCLKLELTESMVLSNVEDTIDKMKQLKALGISFSMDDFGTGYSSLAYLTRLPLDQLKIDRSFVTNLPDNINDGIIARTIITMGRSLALEVVAEGVETAGQREFLERYGCHAYQGYFYSKAVPLESFETFLAANAAEADARRPA
jgi:diguanylate cyclase (GGDEF)-like protein/PAS domain S-box-containing protein